MDNIAHSDEPALGTTCQLNLKSNCKGVRLDGYVQCSFCNMLGWRLCLCTALPYLVAIERVLNCQETPTAKYVKILIALLHYLEGTVINCFIV